MRNYVAVVHRRRGQSKTIEILAPDIKDAAAYVREHFGLWGKDPHKGFNIKEVEQFYAKV